MRHHQTPAGTLQEMPGGGVPCLLPPQQAVWGWELQRGGGGGLLQGVVDAVWAPRGRDGLCVGRLEDPGGALSCIASPRPGGVDWGAIGTDGGGLANGQRAIGNHGRPATREECCRNQ